MIARDYHVHDVTLLTKESSVLVNGATIVVFSRHDVHILELYIVYKAPPISLDLYGAVCMSRTLQSCPPMMPIYTIHTWKRSLNVKHIIRQI